MEPIVDIPRSPLGYRAESLVGPTLPGIPFGLTMRTKFIPAVSLIYRLWDTDRPNHYRCEVLTTCAHDSGVSDARIGLRGLTVLSAGSHIRVVF